MLGTRTQAGCRQHRRRLQKSFPLRFPVGNGHESGVQPPGAAFGEELPHSGEAWGVSGPRSRGGLAAPRVSEPAPPGTGFQLQAFLKTFTFAGSITYLLMFWFFFLTGKGRSSNCSGIPLQFQLDSLLFILPPNSSCCRAVQGDAARPPEGKGSGQDSCARSCTNSLLPLHTDPPADQTANGEFHNSSGQQSKVLCEAENQALQAGGHHLFSLAYGH